MLDDALAECTGRHPAKRTGHFDGGAETLLWYLCERPRHDFGHRLRDVVPDLADRPGRLVRMLAQHRQGRGRLERQRPREHLVQHTAQGIDVRPGVRALPPALLRRHVVRRAHHHARGRHGRQRLAARDAEVRHLRRTVGSDQHVLGLDVPVNNALRVSRGEAVGDLNGERDGTGDGQAPGALDQTDEVLGQELHGDEVPAFCFPDLVDPDDVGVVDR